VEAAQVASKEASTKVIADLAEKTAEAINGVADQIGRVETAQAVASRSSAESVAKLTQEIAQTSKSIKELQETLKSTVTL
jgi:predicted  nucleic acid-binding Zn-ribbon protein